MADDLSTETGAEGAGLSDIAQEILADGMPDANPVPAPPGEKPQGKARDDKGKFQKAKASPEPVESTEDDGDADALLLDGEGDGQEKPKTWELKVNGKTYTAKSEKELVAMAQRGLAEQQARLKDRETVDKMRSELQAKLAEAERRESLAKKDPAEYLRGLSGQAAIDAAEALLTERAQEALAMEKMTPRERQLYQEKKAYEAQLKEHAASKKAEAEKLEAAEVERSRQELGALFHKTITEQKLPANETTVRIMSAIYRGVYQDMERKGIDGTPNHEAIAQLAKQHLKQIADASYGAMSPKEFAAAYPKLADGLRKHFIDEIRAKRAGVSPETQNVRRTNGVAKQKADAPDRDDEWDKYIKRLRTEGSSLRVKNGWG